MRCRVVAGLLFTAGLAGAPCLARDGASDGIAPARNASQPCPGYGTGFVRVPGSPTCIRLSGRVAAGADLRAGDGAAAARPAGAGRFAIDTRTGSDLGPVRTYVRAGTGRR